MARIFDCVVVLAGLGSMSGTLVAGIILGVAESVVLTSLGTSWAPAVAFGILLAVLAVRRFLTLPDIRRNA